MGFLPEDFKGMMEDGFEGKKYSVKHFRKLTGWVGAPYFSATDGGSTGAGLTVAVCGGPSAVCFLPEQQKVGQHRSGKRKTCEHSTLFFGFMFLHLSFSCPLAQMFHQLLLSRQISLWHKQFSDLKSKKLEFCLSFRVKKSRQLKFSHHRLIIERKSLHLSKSIGG